MRPLSKKVRNALGVLAVIACFSVPIAAAAFSTTWTAQFSFTTTSSSSSAPITSAAWLNATISTKDNDSSNFIGSCLLSQDKQSFVCSQSRMAVGESATITAILTNTGNLNETINAVGLSSNSTIMSVTASPLNPTMIPVGKSVTLIYVAKGLMAGFATAEGGIGG